MNLRPGGVQLLLLVELKHCVFPAPSHPSPCKGWDYVHTCALQLANAFGSISSEKACLCQRGPGQDWQLHILFGSFFWYKDWDAYAIPCKELVYRPLDLFDTGHCKCMSYVIKVMSMHFQNWPLYAVSASPFTDSYPQAPMHPHVPQKKRDFLS